MIENPELQKTQIKSEGKWLIVIQFIMHKSFSVSLDAKDTSMNNREKIGMYFK